MLVENTKKSIEALKMLVSEDTSCATEIIGKVQTKINNLELIEEDSDVNIKNALSLLRGFLSELLLFQKRMVRLKEEEDFYEAALEKASSTSHKKFILGKLEEIENKKKIF